MPVAPQKAVVAAAPNHLSTSETARRLGIDRKTLRRWVSDGLFPRPVTAGHRCRWMFPAASVEAWLAEHGSPSQPSNPGGLLDAILQRLAGQTRWPQVAEWARALLAGDVASSEQQQTPVA